METRLLLGRYTIRNAIKDWRSPNILYKSLHVNNFFERDMNIKSLSVNNFT